MGKKYSLFIILFTALLQVLLLSCRSGKKEDSWIALFNGADLADWTPKFSGYPAGVNFMNIFRAEEGLLKVSYSECDSFRGEFGHLFYKDCFTHFRLRIEYRITGGQVPGGPGWAYKNNGIMFHSQSPESMAVEQDFPVSVEVQLLGGAETGERPTANLCTPGTHVMMNGELITRHCTSSSSPTFRNDEWVTLDLLVLGDSIVVHLVNGDTVMIYTDLQIGGDLPANFPFPEGTALREGMIAIQAESHPFEFRKIELLDLSGKKRS